MHKTSFLRGLGVVFLVGCIWALNYWSVSANDELSFAFGGQSSPGEGCIAHIATWGDIVRQQVRDFSHSISCRVIANGVAASFALFDAYSLFDCVNVAVWFLFVALLLSESGLKWSFCGFAVVFWFVWESESCSKTTIHAMNYLWAGVGAILVMKRWRRLPDLTWRRVWWSVPPYFVFGAWSESYSLPMSATLATLWPWDVWRRRVSWTRFVHLVALVSGTLFIALGPSIRNRAGSLVSDGGVAYLLVEKAKLAFRLALHPPFVLIVLALAIVLIACWRRRSLPNAEWSLFTFFAAGFYALVAITGLYRVAMPFLLGGTVLVLRGRDSFGAVGPKLRHLCVCLVLGWIGIAAMIQVRLGSDYREMLARYAADPQGITYLPVRRVFPFQKTCTVDDSHRWHLHFHQLMIGHEKPMAVFSERMYRDWYERGLCGSEEFVDNATPKPWRNFLNSYFPPGDYRISLPSREFSFVTKTGKPCTVRSAVDYR